MSHAEPVSYLSLPEGVPQEELDSSGLKWELKELKPMHKTVASLFAQGKKNVEIAAICDCTPQYVGMLLRQPLVKAYISEMCEVVGTRLEALFAQSVEVISDAMTNGTTNEKLKAARLQLEATKRIGRVDPNVSGTGANVDRLERLAERLISLQARARNGGTFNEDGTPVEEAELQEPIRWLEHSPSEGSGNGTQSPDQPD